MSLGVYIQVPFCQTKCTYCNFHTGVVSRDRYGLMPRPSAAKFRRVRRGKAALRGHEARSTRFTSAAARRACSIRRLSARILETLRPHFAMNEPAAEATLEADPETITRGKAIAWLAAGFNRISLGAQSFNDRELQAAGRMHRRADIFQAVEMLARGAGFGNISMDLIAGLPHQTRESWEDSLSELSRPAARARFHLHAGNR